MAKRKSTPPPVPYRVFLSHATYDKWVANKVREELEAAEGVEVFQDDRDIRGGDNIPDAIQDAIRDSHELAVLFTPQSVERLWVILEIGMAMGVRIRIVPLLHHVEPEQMPPNLTNQRAYRLEELDEYLSDLSARSKETDR